MISTNLDYFEGIQRNILERNKGNCELKFRSQEHHLTGISRYSKRKDEKMILRGLKGYVLLERISQELLELFI